jgi:DNA-binding transcriptional MerR regulator
MKGGLSIGALARRTGSNIQTIRYYEQIGLLPAPPRTEGGQRRYGADVVHRLAFIRHARDLGFDIDSIRELMQLAGTPERPCDDVDRIAEAHLRAVEEKIAKLTALRTELRRMLKECGRGQIAECRVIESLSDHQLCKARRH